MFGGMCCIRCDDRRITYYGKIPDWFYIESDLTGQVLEVNRSRCGGCLMTAERQHATQRAGQNALGGGGQDGADNQTWRFDLEGRLVSKLGFVAEVKDSNEAVGAQVVAVGAMGAAGTKETGTPWGRRWKYEPEGTIISQMNGKVMEISYDGPAPGGKSAKNRVKVTMGRPHGGANQRWTLKKAGLPLFVDSEFPATEEVLPKELRAQGVQWLRPAEITGNPQLLKDGASRFDINQAIGKGALNDCWLLAALAVLAERKDLLRKVVPLHQSFSVNYSGSFHFSFFLKGEPVKVVVDDLIPCQNGRPIFNSSGSKEEFWSILLEKAFAKLNRGRPGKATYRAIDFGMMDESLEVLIGKTGKWVNTQENSAERLADRLEEALDEDALLTVTCEITQSLSSEMIVQMGLVPNHAYSITGFERVKSEKSVKSVKSNKSVNLVRLRNPWGRFEWKGKWSDGSEEWDSISKEKKREMELQMQDDGEFWIPAPVLQKYFLRIYILNT